MLMALKKKRIPSIVLIERKRLIKLRVFWEINFSKIESIKITGKLLKKIQRNSIGIVLLKIISESYKIKL